MGGSCSHSVSVQDEYSRLLSLCFSSKLFASTANYWTDSMLDVEQTIGAFLFYLGDWSGVLRRCDTLNLTMYMSA
jgi:hypothetical protein